MTRAEEAGLGQRPGDGRPSDPLPWASAPTARAGDGARSGDGAAALGPPGRAARVLPTLSTAAAVLGVVAVVLWQLHLPLLLTDTSTTGGDTGAHFMMPAFFNAHLFPHLTGWDPAWNDGYPAYTLYFVLPDVLVAVAAHVIPYDIAFKLATASGSVLLPVVAWGAGRLFRLRPPIPAALAAATLPFLFDYTWTIYGGNLFSTLAGEYAYSFSLALAVLFLGLFARGIRTGRHRGWAALALAGSVLAHIVPGLFACAGAALLTLMELVPGRLALRDDLDGAGGTQRPRVQVLWWAASTTALGLALSAWWLIPFGLRSVYSTSMDYTKVTTYAAVLFPGADLWVLVLAAGAVVLAFLTRSRFGVLVSVLGGLSAAGVVLDPIRSLYNVRILPLWFLCAYLLAGWAFGVAVASGARWARRLWADRWADRWAVTEDGGVGAPDGGAGALGGAAGAQDVGAGAHDGGAGARDGGRAPRRRPRPSWAPGAVWGPVLALLGALVVVVPPFVPSVAAALPRIGIRPGPNQVSVWANWNYTGYGAKSGYPEYRGLMRLMSRIGARDGCGRAMWEYDANENRFGTPEALMLLPYWTHGCIDSQEGLLFESSATTPYHFLNQAELSESPSEAVGGLPYGPVTVPLGVRHLQLLGVRYFMAASPQVEEEAAADPTLRLLATSGPWQTTYEGATLSTTWKVYEVRHAAQVVPLRDEPAVLSGVGPSQTTWLGRIGPDGALTEGPSLRWYTTPSAWPTELVTGGPKAWPRIGAARAGDPPKVAVRPTRVTHVREGTSTISFDVSHPGRPVLVKTSYFPNWHAHGALGPWRATPNLMVVVPTARHVVLSYGTTDVTRAGDAVTVAGLAVLLALAALAVTRRARRHGAPRRRSPARG